MTHSTASREGEERNGLARGYSWWFGFGPFPADDPFSPANLPAGFISSTAEDLSHYMIAQLNGGRYGSAQVLSADGIARMHAAGPNTQNAAGTGYAMGWGVGTRDGVHLADHTGETMRFISRQSMDLDNGRGLIMLTNATNQLPSDDEAFKSLTRGLLQRLEDWPPAPAGLSLHTEYSVLDIVMVVLSIGAIWSMAHLRRWSPPITRRQQVLSWVRAGLELTIPLSVYLQVPSAVQAGISWGTLLVFAPDLGWWLLIFFSLLFFTGLVRSRMLANRSRNQFYSRKEARQWLRTPLSA
jgi:hypothetical protein